MQPKKLTVHLITTVYEGLLKLGTSEQESYSIFYDLDLLNYLLSTSYTSKEACFHDLKKMYLNVSPDETKLEIQISMVSGRFCFTIPAHKIPQILAI